MRVATTRLLARSATFVQRAQVLRPQAQQRFPFTSGRTLLDSAPSQRSAGRAAWVGLVAAVPVVAAAAWSIALHAESPVATTTEHEEAKESGATVVTTTTTTTGAKPKHQKGPEKQTKKVQQKEKESIKKKIIADKTAEKKLAAKKPPPTVDPEKVLYVANRVIFVTDRVDIKMARAVVAQLLYLDSISNEPIQMIINTGGGVVTDGMAIYDTMKMISSPVHTFVVGRASSMGAVISAAGEPGHRYAMPHSQIMIHEISSGYSRSKITDLRIRMQNSERVNEILIACLAKDTHKEKSILRKLMQRDHYMTAKEARGFNIIDHIITSFAVQKPKDDDGKK